MRQVFFAALVSLLVTSSALMAGAKTLSVPSTKYPSIQSAVNASQPSDIIRIAAGTYHESVTVNQRNIQLNGDSGATLQGASEPGVSGITINSGGVTVSGLKIQNYDNGITDNGGGNTIRYNSLLNNLTTGLFCTTGVVLPSSGLTPPQLTCLDHNIVTGNLIGIQLDFCQNVIVSSNVADGNLIGINISSGSMFCSLIANEASNNDFLGIWLSFGQSNLITFNTALNNGFLDAEDDFGGNLWLLNHFGIGKTMGI